MHCFKRETSAHLLVLQHSRYTMAIYTAQFEYGHSHSNVNVLVLNDMWKRNFNTLVIVGKNTQSEQFLSEKISIC